MSGCCTSSVPRYVRDVIAPAALSNRAVNAWPVTVTMSGPSTSASFAPGAGATGLAGRPAGSLNWSYAISSPRRPPQGALAFSVHDTSRKYSTPGCAVMGGSGSVTSLLSRGPSFSGGIVPLAIVVPSACTAHRPASAWSSGVKSCQLVMFTVPAARSTGFTCTYW